MQVTRPMYIPEHFTTEYPKCQVDDEKNYKINLEAIGKIANCQRFFCFADWKITEYSAYNPMNGELTTTYTEGWRDSLKRMEKEGKDFNFIPEKQLQYMLDKFTVGQMYYVLFGYLIGLRFDIIDYYVRAEWRADSEMDMFMNMLLWRSIDFEYLGSSFGERDFWKQYKEFREEYYETYFWDTRYHEYDGSDKEEEMKWGMD